MVSGSYAANAALMQSAYGAVERITPVALIAEAGFIIAMHPGVAAKYAGELIARIVQTSAMPERMAAEGLEAAIAPPECLCEQLREEVRSGCAF
jgi:hypothetical protein